MNGFGPLVDAFCFGLSVCYHERIFLLVKGQQPLCHKKHWSLGPLAGEITHHRYPSENSGSSASAETLLPVLGSSSCTRSGFGNNLSCDWGIVRCVVRWGAISGTVSVPRRLRGQVMVVIVTVAVRRTVQKFAFGAKMMTTRRANSLENDFVSTHVASLGRSVEEILVGSLFLIRELTRGARDTVLIEQIPGHKSARSPGTVGRPLPCFARQGDGIQRCVARRLF